MTIPMDNPARELIARIASTCCLLLSSSIILIFVPRMLACPQSAFALTVQDQKEWTVPMNISLISSDQDSVAFGTRSGATDGLDPSIDVLNPPPPPDKFDAFFEIEHPTFPRLSADYRSNLVPQNSWTLVITATAGANGTIAWNVSEFPVGGLSPGELLIQSGETILADMLTDSTLAFTSDQRLTILFRAAALGIAGRVSYCATANPVANSTLRLSGANQDTVPSDISGNYTIRDLKADSSYSITPSKIGDIGDFTITCFDAALIARIAVGLDVADYCDSLAADVDGNGFIQTFDAALTCRYAVGLPPFGASDHTGEWRFEPASRSYAPLTADQTEQNFTAALLGDVDGNWSPALAPTTLAKVSGSRIGFAARADWSEDGKSLRTRLTYVGGSTALSFELELEYEPEAVQFTGARSMLEGWQVVTYEVADGRVRVGMFSPHGVGEAGPVVELSWDVADESSISDLVLTRAVVDQEEQIATSLELNPADRLPTAFQLYPNYPNPFNPETQIRFDIPAVAGEGVATRLAIYNLAGQLVRVLVDEVRASGEYMVQWDGRTDLGELLPSGMYLYKLEAGSFVATRKLALVR